MDVLTLKRDCLADGLVAGSPTCARCTERGYAYKHRCPVPNKIRTAKHPHGIPGQKDVPLVAGSSYCPRATTRWYVF